MDIQTTEPESVQMDTPRHEDLTRSRVRLYALFFLLHSRSFVSLSILLIYLVYYYDDSSCLVAIYIYGVSQSVVGGRIIFIHSMFSSGELGMRSATRRLLRRQRRWVGLSTTLHH